MGSGIVTGGWEVARRDAHRLDNHAEKTAAVQGVLEAKETWDYAAKAREHLRKREAMEGMGEMMRKVTAMMEKNERVVQEVGMGVMCLVADKEMVSVADKKIAEAR